MRTAATAVGPFGAPWTKSPSGGTVGGAGTATGVSFCARHHQPESATSAAPAGDAPSTETAVATAPTTAALRIRTRRRSPA